jgi:hypothetical protein
MIEHGVFTPNLTLGYLERIKDEALSTWLDKGYIPEDLLKRQRRFDNVLATLPDDITEGKKGCVISLSKRLTPRINEFHPTPPLLLLAGQVDASDKDFGTKQNKYAAYALCKTAVLFMHPEFNASRFNLSLPIDKQCSIAGAPVPGGAIAFKQGDVISVSGYPTGEIDEAIAMLFAYSECYMSTTTLNSLADQIGNTTWRRVKEHFIK